MGALFLPSSSTVASYFAAYHRRDPDAVALIPDEAHHPWFLLPSLLLSVLPLLVAALVELRRRRLSSPPPVSPPSQDPDLLHLPPDQLLPLSRFPWLLHLCIAAMVGSTAVHHLSFLPPLPFSSAAALDLPRLPSSSTAAFLSPFPPCFLSTSTAHLPFPSLLPVLVADVVADHQRPLPLSPLYRPLIPHLPLLLPPFPSPIAFLDGTAVAFSAVASLHLRCRPPPPPVSSPSPPLWLSPSPP